MWTDRVSELKIPVMGISLWEDGAEMSWEEDVSRVEEVSNGSKSSLAFAAEF
jgi:hypothetical protein